MSSLIIASLFVGALGTFIPYSVKNGSVPRNQTLSLDGPIYSTQPVPTFSNHTSSVPAATSLVPPVSAAAAKYPATSATQSASIATEFSSTSTADLHCGSGGPDSAVQDTSLYMTNTTVGPSPVDDHPNSANTTTIWPGTGASDTPAPSVSSEMSTSALYTFTTFSANSSTRTSTSASHTLTTFVTNSPIASTETSTSALYSLTAFVTESPIQSTMSTTSLPISSTVSPSSISKTGETSVSTSQSSSSTQSPLSTTSAHSVTTDTASNKGQAIMSTINTVEHSRTYSPSTTLKVSPVVPTPVMFRA